MSKLGLKNSNKTFLYAIYKQQYLEYIDSGEYQKVCARRFSYTVLVVTLRAQTGFHVLDQASQAFGATSDHAR